MTSIIINNLASDIIASGPEATMNSYTNYITLLLILLFAGAASADTMLVPENYVSIQDAVNCAEAGDTIHVSKGTYHERIAIDKSVLLVGDYAAIDGGCEGDVVTVKADGVTVSGFTLLNGVAGVNISESASESVIENNRINNNEYGIVLMGASDGIIIDNQIRGNTRHGIFLKTARNNVIIENLVTRNHGCGIHLQNSTDNIITDNVFSRNLEPQSVTDDAKSTDRHDICMVQSDGNCINADVIGHVSVPRSPGTLIDGDVVDDARYDRDAIGEAAIPCLDETAIDGDVVAGDLCGSNITNEAEHITGDGCDNNSDRDNSTKVKIGAIDAIDAIDVIDRASVAQFNCTVVDAKGLYMDEDRIAVSSVDNTTTDIRSNRVVVAETGKTLYVPTQYPTIQAAIDNTVNGDTVYVFNGTYIENIVVNKRIMLQGEDRGNTVIDGNGGDVVNIKSPYVNISGFTIRNGGYGIYMVIGRDCRITDCDLHSNIHGIYLWRACRDNVISDCILHSNTNNGIFIFMSSSNNSISGCTAYSNGNNGIMLQKFCNNNTVVNCDASSNQQNGICVFQIGSGNTIRDCTAHSNNGSGIAIQKSSNNNTVLNCATNLNLQSGICIFQVCTGNTIRDCSAHSNNRSGILIQKICTGNTVVNCDARSNQQNGICVFQVCDNNMVADCRAAQNTGDGIFVSHACNGNMVAGCDSSGNINGVHVSHASSGNAVVGCNAQDNINGVHISQASTGNMVTDCDTLNNTNGIFISHASAGNTVTGCYVHSNLRRGIYMAMCSKENNVADCMVDSTVYGVVLSRSSTNNTITDSTITESGINDFLVEYASSGTAVNTGFDAGSVSVRLVSMLSVKNYLDLLVSCGANPIEGADVSVTDGGKTVYASPGYDGSDPKTGSDGLCSGIVVTDRVYYSSVPTENTTLVSAKHGVWEDADRDVNMSVSHTEVFTETATEVATTTVT